MSHLHPNVWAEFISEVGGQSLSTDLDVVHHEALGDEEPETRRGAERVRP